MEKNSTKPQGFFLQQPSTGERKDYCGYYALCNFIAIELDFDKFKDQVYKNYREMYGTSISDQEISNYIEADGTLTEMILTEQEFSCITIDDISEKTVRFMAATNKYGGHWLTYIIDEKKEWWEYDSCSTEPRKIGNLESLRAYLQEISTSAIWSK